MDGSGAGELINPNPVLHARRETAGRKVHTAAPGTQISVQNAHAVMMLIIISIALQVYRGQPNSQGATAQRAASQGLNASWELDDGADGEGPREPIDSLEVGGQHKVHHLQIRDS
jgi:hypothetical protein